MAERQMTPRQIRLRLQGIQIWLEERIRITEDLYERCRADLAAADDQDVLELTIQVGRLSAWKLMLSVLEERFQPVLRPSRLPGGVQVLPGRRPGGIPRPPAGGDRDPLQVLPGGRA